MVYSIYNKEKIKFISGSCQFFQRDDCWVISGFYIDDREFDPNRKSKFWQRRTSYVDQTYERGRQSTRNTDAVFECGANLLQS